MYGFHGSTTWRSRRVLAGILAIQATILAGLATQYSPTYGEVPGLASGVWHWTTGNFDPFRVNPPLVRMVAAIPVLAQSPATDWHRTRDRFGYRWEFDVGNDFVTANGERSMWLFTSARWACIPFVLLGGWVCWKWASDLYGGRAGTAAALLWSCSPMVLGHGALMTADVPAAAFGSLASYLFWRWLRVPSGPRAVAVGVALGLVCLVKTTWIVLFVLWPPLWIGWRLFHCRRGSSPAWWQEGVQLLAAAILAVLVIHLGYGLERPLTRLEDFRFVSQTLGGGASARERLEHGANRFGGTWLGNLPVPLPANFVLGLDIQKRDFEIGEWTWLGGEWSQHGRWWFYLFGLLVKTPEGILVLALISIVMSLTWRSRASGMDQLVLLAPSAAVLMLASSQTALNTHFRYAIPAFPFLLIFSSQSLETVGTSGLERAARLTAKGAVLMSIAAAVWAFPNYIGYFNIASGGNSRRPPLMLGSSCDWGQDLLFLKRWHESSASGEPLALAATPGAVPAAVGLQLPEPPRDPAYRYRSLARRNEHAGPQPRLLAVSVNRLYGRHHEFDYLLTKSPIRVIGTSLLIFRLEGAQPPGH